MQFSSLPAEVVSAILLASVQVRGAKHALRLRLVCRHFSTAVEYAVFESGALSLEHAHHADRVDLPMANDDGRGGAPAFWRRYLAHRVLSPRGPPLPLELRLIVKVAEHITRFRRRVDGDGDGDQNKVLGQYQFEHHLAERVARLSRLFVALYGPVYKCLVYPEHRRDDDNNDDAPSPVPGWTEDLQHHVLVAAAYLGEDQLVRHQIDTYNLDTDKNALDWALRAATHGGQAQVISTLLSTPLLSSTYPKSSTLMLIENSMVAGRAEMLELGLATWRGLKDGSYANNDLTLNNAVIDGAWAMAADLDLFKLAYAHLTQEHAPLVGKSEAARQDNLHWERRLQRAFVRVRRLAASNGDVALMSFLLDECPLSHDGVKLLPPLPPGKNTDKPVNSTRRRLDAASRFLDEASANGRADAVAWLMEQRGARVNMPGSLVSAAKGGSIRVLEAVLRRYLDQQRQKGGDEELPKEAIESALGIAVARQHDAVAQRLVVLGTGLRIDMSGAVWS